MPRRWPSIGGFTRLLSTYGAESQVQVAPNIEPSLPRLPPLQVREHFALPTRVPSWFVGHMYRAMRSLPSLLERKPPPLIIEVRDARLPFSSINVAFEQLLERMGQRGAFAKSKSTENNDDQDAQSWRNRRLIVYNKADLIDQRLIDPIVSAFSTLQNQEVMFVNSAKDRDVSKVIKWVKGWASKVADTEEFQAIQEEKAIKDATKQKRITKKEALAIRRPASNLSGAFRHTTTPEDGVRLVIVGMPNVGKSSLLNALRRVGTGKGKAASTAPEPGHTRKLTGTVRITPQKKKVDMTSPLFQLDNPTAPQETRAKGPDIYVYDTPGVMVPFLGHGEKGSETAMKLMVTAGMKTMWFDKLSLADYLLYRMNKRWSWAWKQWNARGGQGKEPRPAYLEHLPIPDHVKPTNDVDVLLEHLALKAPGTLTKGGIRDLEGAAGFMIQQWRDGKLGVAELDLGTFEDTCSASNHRQEGSARFDLMQKTRESFAQYFEEARKAETSGVGTSSRPAKGADRASRRTMEAKDSSSLKSVQLQDSAMRDPLLSNNQAKRRRKSVDLALRNSRLREKGVRVKTVFSKQPSRASTIRKGSSFKPPTRPSKAKGSKRK